MGRWTERGALPWLVAFIGLGLVLHIVGFATYHWTVVTTSDTSGATAVKVKNYTGLWEYCQQDAASTSNNKPRTCYDVDLDKLKDWFQASQALECIGLVGYVVCFILIFLMMREPRSERDDYRYSLKIASITLLAFSGGMILVGAIIFILKDEDDWEGYADDTLTLMLDNHEAGYSSILCIVAGVIAFICLFLMACLVYVPKPRWAFGWGDPYGPYGPRDFDYPSSAKYGGYPRNVPPEYSMGSYRY